MSDNLSISPSSASAMLNAVLGVLTSYIHNCSIIWMEYCHTDNDNRHNIFEGILVRIALLVSDYFRSNNLYRTGNNDNGQNCSD